MFILIVTHPRIIPHDSVKNRILLLKNYKIVNSLLNKAQSGPNKLSSKLPCSKPTAHAINSNCCSSLTCLYVCSRIGSMLEQVSNQNLCCYYICSFVYTVVKNNFHVCKNSSAPSINAALWHYLGTYNLDFRHENNSTPGVLIEEIRYTFHTKMVWFPDLHLAYQFRVCTYHP